MTVEILHPPRNLHERRFSRHVEYEASEVFWMRQNPFADALKRLEDRLRSPELALSSHEDEDEDIVQEKPIHFEAIKRSCERLFTSVLRSCDTYLAAYYDLVLAVQGGRTLDNRSFIEDADASRRRSHIALTTNIRILVRNLKNWGIDPQGLDEFVIQNDMDAKREEIGNFALHFAFSRYISS
jgi:hypothetical protein